MPSRRPLSFFWKLFASTFTISAFTFGGGFVIIPLMRKKFVEQLGWLGEEEMLDLTAIAQSAPGPIAVNASILVGYRTAGIPGSLVAILGTVLPPLIILSVISLFYEAFRSSAAVAAVLRGMQAGIAAVIADVTITLGANVLRERRLIWTAILLGAFAVTLLTQISVMLVILFCGALGWLTTTRLFSKKGA